MKKVFLFLFSLMFALFLVEVSVRVSSLFFYKVKLLTYNPKINRSYGKITSVEEIRENVPFYLPPGSLVNGFRTNSKGFLTPEVKYEKPDDVYRIVLIGDSFAVGVVPYDEHFIRILESRLNESKIIKKKIEVINLGIDSIGPGMYERVLAIEGVLYHPDLVLVSLFVGNDLTDHYYFDDNNNVVSNVDSQMAHWFDYIRTYSLIKNVAALTQVSKKILASDISPQKGQVLGVNTKEGIQNYDPFNPSMSEEEYLKILKEKKGLYFKDGDLLAPENLQSVRDSIQNIDQDIKSENTKVTYLILPDEMQFSPELRREVITESEEKNGNFDLTLPQERAKEILDAEKASYIDIYPFMERDENIKSFYQPRDTHLNSIGNQEVANILIEQLKSTISDGN